MHPLHQQKLIFFLILKVKKENLKNIVDDFLFNLNLNLQAEGFPIQVIGRVMQVIRRSALPSPQVGKFSIL